MKKISLISTVYNEEANISAFLQSYKKQTRIADEYVIVDGGSNDATVSIIENFAKENPNLNIKLIIDKTCSKKFSKGPIAKGRNIAIQNAQYDYIAATDAGCILNNNWFEELVKPFEEDDSIDVISGWYEGLADNEFQKIYDLLYMPKLNQLCREKFLPSSRNIAFKKKCWEEIGGYPEETYTAEDTVYDIRLKKAGFKFFFNEKAIVKWELPKNLEEAKKKHYNYAYGDGQNLLYIITYIYWFLGVICPIKLLVKHRKTFNIRYQMLCSIVFGYLNGAVKQFFTKY